MLIIRGRGLVQSRLMLSAASSLLLRGRGCARCTNNPSFGPLLAAGFSSKARQQQQQQQPSLNKRAAGAARDVRALLRPLIRKVHPDLIADAPQRCRDENARHLATLHALIDTLEQGDLSKLAPRYSFNFYTRRDDGEAAATAATSAAQKVPGEQSRESTAAVVAAAAAAGSSEEAEDEEALRRLWRSNPVSMVFPSVLMRAPGGAAKAASRTHVDKQLRGLLSANGILSSPAVAGQGQRGEVGGEEETGTGDEQTANSTNSSSRSSRSGGVSEEDLTKSALAHMLRRESTLGIVNDTLSFLYGGDPFLHHGMLASPLHGDNNDDDDDDDDDSDRGWLDGDSYGDSADDDDDDDDDDGDFADGRLSRATASVLRSLGKSRQLHRRRGGAAAMLPSDEQEATLRIAALFRSGRVLIARDLMHGHRRSGGDVGSGADDGATPQVGAGGGGGAGGGRASSPGPAAAALALRRFGLALLKQHSALHVTHPAWLRAVVLLHNDSAAFGFREPPPTAAPTTAAVADLVVGFDRLGVASFAGRAEPLGADLIKQDDAPPACELEGLAVAGRWVLRVPVGFEEMQLVREVAARARW